MRRRNHRSRRRPPGRWSPLIAVLCCALVLAAASDGAAPPLGPANIEVASPLAMASVAAAPPLTAASVGATSPLAGLPASAQSSTSAQLADAARRNDAEAVRALLAERADVNAALGDGMTALHWAAVHGAEGIVAMLIDAQARLDPRTRIGDYTPLHLAARGGRAAVVEALLIAGADAAAVTSTGAVTALHFAAMSGDAVAARQLVAAGVSVDARETQWGQTPLMFAAAANRPEVIEVLLAAGADPAIAAAVVDIPSREEQDRIAASNRDATPPAVNANTPTSGAIPAPALPQRVTTAPPPSGPPPAGPPPTGPPPTGPPPTGPPPTGPPPTGPPPTGPPPTGPPPTGPPPTGPPPTGPPPTGPPPAGAPPTGPPPTGAVPTGPPPTGAAPTGRTPQERLLGTTEIDPLSYADLVGSHGGLTAMLLAAREGHREAAQALLAGGAGIDRPSAGDRTAPLLMAAINGHFDLAMWLLERGADPTAASVAGATPLYAILNMQWVPKSRHPHPTDYMQQQVGYLDAMRALLEAGADPNARLEKTLWFTTYNNDLLRVDRAGATPFWRAAFALDVDAMRLLVEYGADPGIPTKKMPSRARPGAAPDESGLPPVPVGAAAVFPIHAASGVGYGQGFAGNSHRHVPGGWMAAVRYLVEVHGADVNARDVNGYSPVHHAASRGDNDLIEYLVSQGADVTFVSRRGQTTVDMANGPVQRIQPFPETIALLEALGAKNNHNCVSC